MQFALVQCVVYWAANRNKMTQQVKCVMAQSRISLKKQTLQPCTQFYIVMLHQLTREWPFFLFIYFFFCITVPSFTLWIAVHDHNACSKKYISPLTLLCFAVILQKIIIFWSYYMSSKAKPSLMGKNALGKRGTGERYTSGKGINHFWSGWKRTKTCLGTE